ncbi:hypothetical protein CVT26_015371 [Gymnopilus dilepis]|uniref:Protein kinase domain-containing protein n=1 Tax=Gymnopilus dilepis TaxID=231916 RepID=A0A409WA96_9AGAR|nr:hypothetical protein CVT26_015371 [Gymnopilus dilepis]
MCRQHVDPFSPYFDSIDEIWDKHYLVLDTLGRYFLANFPQDLSSPADWPKLRRALHQMPSDLFWDLCVDVHEEIFRRNNDLRDGVFSLASPAGMPLGRLHIRKKLSTISTDRFHALCLRVAFEAGKRSSRPRPQEVVEWSRSLRQKYGPGVSCLAPALGLNKTPLFSDDLKSQSKSRWELNRSLDNLPNAQSWPQEVDMGHFYSQYAAHDSFTETMSVVFSLFMSVLQNKGRFDDLLSRRQEAQEVVDVIQMLLDYRATNIVAKRTLIAALTHLSICSGLHPRRLTLRGVTKKDLVASGSFGDIWTGLFQGKLVCLKVVRMYQGSSKSRILKEYSKEAILWGHLSHPNILPFYGIYQLEDEDQRASDIAHGLQYLHKQGIIHGDLKGANILVTKSGRACLADFGLSVILDTRPLTLDPSCSSNGIGGTIRWLAPELLDPDFDNLKPSLEADIYSFGCVLYEIFTGKYPFHEYGRDVTVILRVMEGKKPSLPGPGSMPYEAWGLNNYLRALMEECWVTDPGRRPSACQVLSRLALMQLVDTRPPDSWEDLSPSNFRNAIYRIDHLSLRTLETALSWI